MCIQDGSKFVVDLLNGLGDHVTLGQAVKPAHLRTDIRRMSRRQIIDYLTVNGHCSAFVKVHPMCLYLVGTVTVEIRSRIVDRLLVLHTYTPSNGASILCIAFCPSLCLSVVPYVLVIQEEKVIDRKSSVAYFQKCFL